MVAILNLGICGFGLALYEQSWLSEGSARLYCITACIVALVSVLWNDRRISNWMLWLQVTYFAFFPLGSFVGILTIGTSESFLNYPTTFSNGISIESRALSYVVSGLVAPLLTFFYLVFPPQRDSALPTSDPGLEKLGRMAILVSVPFTLAIYMSDAISAWNIGYAAIYTAAFRETRAVGPLSALWTNLTYIGFIVFFASIPSERRFRPFAALFLLLAFFDSLKGARILFLVPVAFLIWYRARVYGRNYVSKRAILIMALLGGGFVYALDVLRQVGGIQAQNVFRFLAFAISKAQYTLALYIDNKHLLVGNQPYWLAPLTFPFNYLTNRAGVVGQSETSAALRGDLGHALSSQLNYAAYLQGAGTGSTFVAEAFQYGLLPLFALSLLYYLSYRLFFSSLGNRLVLGWSVLVFQHFVFSPRDTMFPNGWGFVKIGVAMALIWIIRELVRLTADSGPVYGSTYR